MSRRMNEQLKAYAHLTGEPVPDKPEEGYDMTQFGHWDPPDDTLSAEQVAEMRAYQLSRDARADEDIIDLCDTVDVLREHLREAQEARQVLADGCDGFRLLYEEQKAEIRHLTDALREAKPALLYWSEQATEEASETEKTWSGTPREKWNDGVQEYIDRHHADAATLRALAEMGESDG